MKRTFLYILTLMAINIHASAINQTTYAYWYKPDVEVFYITPKKIDKDTIILDARNENDFVEQIKILKPKTFLVNSNEAARLFLIYNISSC